MPLMLAGSGEKRPPTKAAMLDGLCRRLKPRRGQPLIDVGGGVQLAYFLEQPVLLGTVRELGDLRFQPGLLGCNSIFKCMGNGSATLHDTTSCLRVLAVGFADAILICRRPAICSEVNTVKLVAPNQPGTTGARSTRLRAREPIIRNERGCQSWRSFS